ncbi:MAG: DUF5320 domain-containing protein [Desulfobacter sp.]|nr:MAG: DUF5320 domain-containing protein [Desulfobacter sp.]
MPGLDQRGPEGRGAMTGRRQGICQGGGGQSFAGGRGRGCRRGGGAGRGFGQGAGQGASRGYGRGNAAAPMPYTETRTSLQDRAKMLEDELNAVKDQLNAMSEKE